MLKARRRKKSIVLFVIAALIVGAGCALIAALSQPEAARQLWAVATIDRSGSAHVTETVDYHFKAKRHGIYRVLPDVPITDATQIQVHSDTYHAALATPQGDGTRLRIGDPNHTIGGNHRYVISYPLTTLHLSTGQFGWNGVGTGWDVPVLHTELDVVAPWKWENPTCDAGSGGSYGNCTADQPEPGHLIVSHGPLKAHEGLTVYARQGAALATAPSPRSIAAPVTTVAWWRRPMTLGVLVALAMIVSALVVARLLRRAGRDWVMAAAASTGNAAALAFSQSGSPGSATRVDDRDLEQYVTTEFAPPPDLAPWQGGIVSAESVGADQQTAWLLNAAAQGYIDIDERGKNNVVVTAEAHPSDATSMLLAVGFGGRSELKLGSYDPVFAAMWSSLPAMFTKWKEASGLSDPAAERRITRLRPVAFVALIFAAIGLIGAAAVFFSHPTPALLVGAIGGVAFGAGLAGLVRAWELHVRTPAGSALWLRVESFRRFLANSEAHHVAEAAKRGVLRDYTAWAVALGEVDHWSAMVASAGLPPDTAGIRTAMIAPMLSSGFNHTASAPSSSGSSGGGGGVGGGGGGGGGGSW